MGKAWAPHKSASPTGTVQTKRRAPGQIHIRAEAHAPRESRPRASCVQPWQCPQLLSNAATQWHESSHAPPVQWLSPARPGQHQPLLSRRHPGPPGPGAGAPHLALSPARGDRSAQLLKAWPRGERLPGSAPQRPGCSHAPAGGWGASSRLWSPPLPRDAPSTGLSPVPSSSWRRCPACCTCPGRRRASRGPAPACSSGGAAPWATWPRRRSTSPSSPAASSCLRSSRSGTGWPAASPPPVSAPRPGDGVGATGLSQRARWLL